MIYRHVCSIVKVLTHSRGNRGHTLTRLWSGAPDRRSRKEKGPEPLMFFPKRTALVNDGIPKKLKEPPFHGWLVLHTSTWTMERVGFLRLEKSETYQVKTIWHLNLDMWSKDVDKLWYLNEVWRPLRLPRVNSLVAVSESHTGTLCTITTTFL